ncbi:hypothetical protein EHRUM4_06460, partial [Ehrlichia ruminantium]
IMLFIAYVIISISMIMKIGNSTIE